MAQANWWDNYEPAGQAQGPIIGPAPVPKEPPAVNPAEEARKQRDQEIQEAKFRLEQERAGRETSASGASESERTAGFLGKRIVDAVGRLTTAGKADPAALSPTMGVEAVRGVLGNTAANYITDPEHQQIRAAQIDILDAALTLGTGAAYTKEQIEGYREAYFPKLGDDPATVRSKQAALKSLLESAQVKAGRSAPDIASAIAALDAMETTTEFEPGPGGDDDEGGPRIVRDRDGNVLYIEEDVVGDNDSARAIADEQQKREGAPGVSALAQQGMTLGLSDEAAGLGGAIGTLLTGGSPVQGYRDYRDAERIRLDRARENTGAVGTGVELLGGLSSGGLGTFNTIRGAATGGAALGGLAGYGYGEGLGPSTVNALTGATLGGVLGAGGQKLGNTLANRQRPAIPNAPEVAAAGKAEGVTVNRAMVDPSVQNRITGVETSMAGGPRFNRGMQEIEGQIEGRVGALGQGGDAMNTTVAGQSYQKAGERFIKTSGKQARVKYDRAEKLAGDAKVAPTQSLALADEMIGKLGGAKKTGLLDANGNPIMRNVEGSGLSETPATNSAEIAFLQSIRSDLSKDLSVASLRRMRTSLRKKISKGELVFGEDEARILGIMDTAADDIRTGLAQQGKGAAARAFDEADKAYRGRMEYINGTLQKIIGKRGSNLSAERVAANLSGMARGKDTEGVRKFLGTLNPDERADVAATFAEALGRNNKGEFSIAHFLTQTSEKQFPKGALKVVFGDEGAASIDRLRTLSKEVARVNSMRNSSNTARGGDYRSWLFNAMLGVGTGAGTGSVTTGIATAVIPAGIKAGRDVLSARMLLSPDISKWIASAPRTANPAAINAHIAKLGTLGGVTRMDAKAIQEYLMGAAQQSPGRAAAEDEAN